MATYNNYVPRNVKARTILKSGTEVEWAKARNFKPLFGEPIIWESCQKHGPGWFKEDNKFYYANTEKPITENPSSDNDDLYKLQNNRVIVWEPEPGSSIDDDYYYVDENGYVFKETVQTIKGVQKTVPQYLITNRRFKVGNKEQDDVMSENLFIDTPRIGDEEEDGYKYWYIGQMKQNAIAEPKITIKNGQWVVNGKEIGAAVGAPFKISKVYPSYQAMIDNVETDDVPLYGFAMISVPISESNPEIDVDHPDTASLYVKDTETTYSLVTDLSGAQGVQGPAPYIGENGNWWIEGEDTNISASGESGDLQLYTEIAPDENGNFAFEAGIDYKIYAENDGENFICKLSISGETVGETTALSYELPLIPFQNNAKSFVFKLLDVHSYPALDDQGNPTDSYTSIEYIINEEPININIHNNSVYDQHFPNGVISNATKVGVLQNFVNLEDLKGDDYVLTEDDKQEIADLILEGLDKWQGGSY